MSVLEWIALVWFVSWLFFRLLDHGLLIHIVDPADFDQAADEAVAVVSARRPA
jgi:hypothetical protein